MHDRNTGIHPLETGLDEATVARWKAGVQAEREAQLRQKRLAANRWNAAL